VSGFGECASCGCSVERPGWDELCFRCQESEKAEMEPYDERDADQDDDHLAFDEAYGYGGLRE
jgi:hypothetical protein